MNGPLNTSGTACGAMCYWDGANLRLKSRNLLPITHRYPELADLGKALGKGPILLDGEIVALDADGKVSFSQLQLRMHADPATAARRARQTPVWYFVFDVLYAAGEALFDHPYSQRRALVEGLALDHPARANLAVAHRRRAGHAERGARGRA